MPQRRNSAGPPPMMTWGTAIPVIVVAFTFDLVRIFFEWFWFFGPALGAVACTAGVNSTVGASTGGLVGNAVATVCTAGAVALGAVFSESTIAFGVVMAEAVALIGWLTIGLWAFTTNQRMFKENGEDAMHVVLLYLSILISFIPILGTAPTVGMITYRFYKFQIKIEKAALKKYEEEQGATQLQERRQQEAQRMQYQAGRVAQAQQIAANDAVYAEAANEENYDEEEIPEEVRRAA